VKVVEFFGYYESAVGSAHLIVSMPPIGRLADLSFGCFSDFFVEKICFCDLYISLIVVQFRTAVAKLN
jgi:hypothetical protein